MKKHKLFQVLQGSLVVVFTGIGINYCAQQGFLSLSLAPDQLVNIPVPENIAGFFGQFTFPDFSVITRFEVWKIAFLIAVIASLETLLSVEAADKLDPYKRVTPPNRELKAQGLGNIVSGLCGGLPITQVIVRSSVNISFGGKTKLSAILHGVFILISAITLAEFLNRIPLASLAAILITVGYKLARPALFKEMYAQGNESFVPFVATVIGLLTTDLLTGIAIGMVFGIFYTLRNSYLNGYSIRLFDEGHRHLRRRPRNASSGAGGSGVLFQQGQHRASVEFDTGQFESDHRLLEFQIDRSRCRRDH
jgi:Sulfate permease and related transporters (MFS superfamily)